MLDSTVNNIGQVPCASALVLWYTASVSNPAASDLVLASSALVTNSQHCAQPGAYLL